MSVIAIYLLFSMLAVIWLDATRYIIPNWLTGSLLLLYPLAVWMAPVPVEWKMALVGMLGVFVVGYIVFMMKWMGGGDIKLLIVMSLWVGLPHLADFIFLVGVLGGVLSVVLWGVRKVLPYIVKDKSLPRILHNGEPAPYGIAIAIAVIALMWLGYMPLAKIH